MACSAASWVASAVLHTAAGVYESGRACVTNGCAASTDMSVAVFCWQQCQQLLQLLPAAVGTAFMKCCVWLVVYQAGGLLRRNCMLFIWGVCLVGPLQDSTSVRCALALRLPSSCDMCVLLAAAGVSAPTISRRHMHHADILLCVITCITIHVFCPHTDLQAAQAQLATPQHSACSSRVEGVCQP